MRGIFHLLLLWNEENLRLGKKYGYTKWDYTELLFSAGRISMESLEMLVKMTKEEQGRFFTEFRSLLMDE